MLSRLTVFLYLALAIAATARASPMDHGGNNTAPDSDQPIMKLDKAIVVGTTTGSVTSFRGIPFAQPP